MPAWYESVRDVRRMAEFYGCSFFEMQQRLNTGEAHLRHWWVCSVIGEADAREIKKDFTL